MNSKTLSIAGASLAVLVSFILFGCSSKPSGKDVMAKVNGKKILRSEVDKYYQSQTAGAPEQLSSEQADALRLNVLQDLIMNEIIKQRAEKDGLQPTDAEVDSKITELKQPYTEEEFQKGLKEQHLTFEDLKDKVRKQLTIDKVITKEISSKIEIKDSDVSAYYNSHKAEFNLVEPQYHLADIFVSNMASPVRNLKNSKAQNDAEAQKKIRELENRLNSGEDFAMVASNYSEDDAAMNGGDLGNLPESNLKSSDPSAREAVLKLKPGQYTGVITARGPDGKQVVGYRVIKLLEKQPSGQRDLNDPRVQEFIRGRLRQSSEQLRRAAFYEVLRNNAKIENYYAENLLKAAK